MDLKASGGQRPLCQSLTKASLGSYALSLLCTPEEPRGAGDLLYGAVGPHTEIVIAIRSHIGSSIAWQDKIHVVGSLLPLGFEPAVAAKVILAHRREEFGFLVVRPIDFILGEGYGPRRRADNPYHSQQCYDIHDLPHPYLLSI
jgi:hypothetical protein